MNDGFVYVATGAGYVAEALGSLRSLRKVMPHARVALVTDIAPSSADASCFDHVIVRTDTLRQPIDKLLAWHAPFDRCVFLDTDTHVAGDLGGLFQILDGFDLAATPETLRGWDYELPGVPHAFPEFNTGVIAFRRTSEAASFFSEWARLHRVLALSEGFVSDQPAFRAAAFAGKARIAPLPSEYHFITGTPNYAMWQLHLLHGRGDMAGLAENLNQRLEPRVYVPNLGIIAGYQGRKHWFQQGCLLFIRYVATLIRPPRKNTSSLNQNWISRESAQREQLKQSHSSS